jgi:hypothetical protein
MKIATPVITLIVGLALAASLLVSSMSAVSGEKDALARASAAANAIAVHKPSGLYQSIETVRGATVKAGWIVLANGTQVGSLEPDSTSATPSARTAPKLDISTLTAQDGDTTLTATPIDGETGSGF